MHADIGLALLRCFHHVFRTQCTGGRTRIGWQTDGAHPHGTKGICKNSLVGCEGNQERKYGRRRSPGQVAFYGITLARQPRSWRRTVLIVEEEAKLDALRQEGARRGLDDDHLALPPPPPPQIGRATSDGQSTEHA